jgi:proteasome lid subunit RPN8/RPN11
MIPRRLAEEIVTQARSELPLECCGLLAGALESGEERTIARVLRRYPLVNEAASPRLYRCEKSLFAAFKDMRAQGLEHLAIYHSHPTSPPEPSPTDREQNFYGTSVMHLIVSLAGPVPEIRGWWLGEDEVRAADWRVVEE